MVPEDIDSLAPGRDHTRREFVRSALGSGFAAAVLPVAAQTVVHTGSEGLLAGPVSIALADGTLSAYRAAPAGRRGAPLVLLVSEIFGVHEHIADVARRLAQAGCFVVAPELFTRQGDVARYTEISRLMAEVVQRVPDAQVMADLDAAVAWAAAEGADAGRLGITGFCWGGRIAWLYAAHNPRVRAAVAWYGRLVGAATALTPEHPVDVAGRLQAPVLGLYGGQDAGIPADTVARMNAALAEGSAAARASRIVVYPDAPHAFHADYRPSYRRAEAEDGWRRLLDWFRAQGVL
jgi:carboxymethylenebutenolidase